MGDVEENLGASGVSAGYCARIISTVAVGTDGSDQIRYQFPLRDRGSRQSTGAHLYADRTLQPFRLGRLALSRPARRAWSARAGGVRPARRPCVPSDRSGAGPGDRLLERLLPVRQRGRTCLLAGPDGGVWGGARAPRCLLAERRGVWAAPRPRKPRERLLRLLWNRPGGARCRSAWPRGAVDRQRPPRPGRRDRGGRPTHDRAPGSRIPPTSPTSPRRSPPATRAASIPTAPARRRRSPPCRRSRSGTSPTRTTGCRRHLRGRPRSAPTVTGRCSTPPTRL